MTAGGAETLVACRLGAIAALHAQSSNKDTLTIIRIDTHALQHYNGRESKLGKSLSLSLFLTLTIGIDIIVHFVCHNIGNR